jgi:hypothetical protein
MMVKRVGPRPGILCKLLVVIAVTMSCSCLLLCGPVHANGLDFPNADFVIRSPDGAQIIGHSHYEVTHEGDKYFLRGENVYLSGEYDTEVEELKLPSPGAMPELVSYKHSFFRAGGKPQIDDWLDVASGRGTCTSYRSGRPVTTTEVFSLPPDVYAGASLLMAVQHALRHNQHDAVELHDFNCIPSPKVFRVETASRTAGPWRYHAGELVKVGLKPNFGWWTILVTPFLPKPEVWFDPTQDWSFVGGKLSRYYEGPKVMLVRTATDGRTLAVTEPPHETWGTKETAR